MDSSVIRACKWEKFRVAVAQTISYGYPDLMENTYLLPFSSEFCVLLSCLSELKD